MKWYRKLFEFLVHCKMLIKMYVVISYGFGFLICAPTNDNYNFQLRAKRCTKSECEGTEALSYCGPLERPCNSGHENSPDGKCDRTNKRCCRTACNGAGSYCFHKNTPCLKGHIETAGKCPVTEYRCCRPL